MLKLSSQTRDCILAKPSGFASSVKQANTSPPTRVAACSCRLLVGQLFHFIGEEDEAQRR